MKKNKISIKGTEITLFSKNEDDYISITDIAKFKNKDVTGLVISHWLSAKYTIEFMRFWEQMHNPDFNVTEFSNIRNEAGSMRNGIGKIRKRKKQKDLTRNNIYKVAPHT